MRAVALIPAAGRGRRMGAERPKAFLPLQGAPLLAHTLRQFENCASVAEILPIVPEKEVGFCAELVRDSGFKKIPRVVPGGPERQDSVYTGLQAVTAADFVLIHDGARPFVSPQFIEAIIAETERWGAVAAALPVSDTLKEVSPEGEIIRTLDRARFWVMQTPQCFRYDLILRAHERARAEAFLGTDDAALAERLGTPVRVLSGSRLNMKITTPEDLIVAEALLKHQKNMSGRPAGSPRRDGGNRMLIGFGYDVHPLIAGRKLILGGVEIPFEKGLDGHSDADVLLHAICDAILGAMGERDIGKRFPNTDPRYRGISSLKLLADVAALMAGKGLTIGNVDATVVAERPMIGPYFPQMVENIASALGIEVRRVNLKATTSEGLGFVGEGKGIVAYAAVLLKAVRGEP